MSTAPPVLLRATDQAFLDTNFEWTATIENGMVCVVIADFVMPVGLAPDRNELLIRLPSGFPDIGPDMFWFAIPVTRHDGAPIPATELTETYLDRSWQRWSRHIGNRWRPGIDDLRSYVTYVRACLRAAA